MRRSATNVARKLVLGANRVMGTQVKRQTLRPKLVVQSSLSGAPAISTAAARVIPVVSSANFSASIGHAAGVESAMTVNKAVRAGFRKRMAIDLSSKVMKLSSVTP